VPVKNKKKVRGQQIRFPDSIHGAIKEKAEANRRSFNSQVVFLIEKALKRSRPA
jgi:hypothetical protein